MNEISITAALTGSDTVPSQTPHLPLTPEQIAEEAYRAWNAGAAVVHVHVRNPGDGRPSADPDLFHQTAGLIRQRTF